MTGIVLNLAIDWRCKHSWKIASYNTSWCLLGCAIGDLGTIAADADADGDANVDAELG